LVGEVIALARLHPHIKTPSNAGSMGNLRIEAAGMKSLSVGGVRRKLMTLLGGIGWCGEFPLAVSAWQTPVFCGPSAQLWIPLPCQGPLVPEGFYTQEVLWQGGKFVGAVPVQLDRMQCSLGWSLHTYVSGTKINR
jgi:hypothetical protein